MADAATGDVRDVMDETVAKFYESGNDKVNWKYLSKTNELLWFSERDNWGQMYLYDLTTGKLKNQITHGDGNVTQVLHVDEAARTIYFSGSRQGDGARSLLRSTMYSVKFDGQGHEAADAGECGPCGDVRRRMDSYFVDVYSTATQPQTAVVRDSDRQGGGRGGEAGHHEAGGGGMGSSDADYGEGS